jgi:hypothetical protein
MDKRPIFRTDEAVPKLEYIGSGTETTASLTKLLSSKTSNSPGCAKCDNAVVFHLIRAMVRRPVSAFSTQRKSVC